MPMDLPLSDDFDAGGIVVGIAVLIVLGILIAFLLPLMILLVEVLIILGAIVLLGGVWVVEASTAGPPPESRSRKVWGGRRSERAAENLAHGVREIQIGSSLRE